MSQSFVKKPDNGPHSALAGLGVLSTERPAADPADVLRRIVAWRDNVHAGHVVRGTELEALIEEGRHALGVGVGALSSETCVHNGEERFCPICQRHARQLAAGVALGAPTQERTVTGEPFVPGFCGMPGCADCEKHKAGVRACAKDEVRERMADALAKLVCEPGKPEYLDQARAALAEHMGTAAGVALPAQPKRYTRSELLAMFGADYTSDHDVMNRAGCCAVCFDARECVDNMQCKANLSTLTRIAPDPDESVGVGGTGHQPFPRQTPPGDKPE